MRTLRHGGACAACHKAEAGARTLELEKKVSELEAGAKTLELEERIRELEASELKLRALARKLKRRLDQRDSRSKIAGNRGASSSLWRAGLAETESALVEAEPQPKKQRLVRIRDMAPRIELEEPEPLDEDTLESDLEAGLSAPPPPPAELTRAVALPAERLQTVSQSRGPFSAADLPRLALGVFRNMGSFAAALLESSTLRRLWEEVSARAAEKRGGSLTGEGRFLV
jgi:hypothetical protein